MGSSGILKFFCLLIVVGYSLEVSVVEWNLSGIFGNILCVVGDLGMNVVVLVAAGSWVHVEVDTTVFFFWVVIKYIELCCIGMVLADGGV